MTDLMSDHAREFRLIICQRHQPARHIDIAAGQRERIDHRAVEQGHAVGPVGLIGRARNARRDTRHIGAQFHIVIGAAISLENFRMRVGARLRFLRGGHDGSDLPFTGRRVGRAP